MPQLSDLVQKRKFVKKEYRPWDLSGSGTVDHKETDDSLNFNPATQVPVKEQIDVINEKTTIVENVTINPSDKLALTPCKNITLTDNKIGNDLGNDLGNKQVTIRKQTGNNQVTANNQLGNKQVTIREQTGNELGNELGNTDDLASLIRSVKKLVGIQKNIFYHIISLCSARGVLDTGSIISNDLATAANCTVGSAKTSIIRLIEKKLIFRLQGKTSRGGHIILAITKGVQAAAIQAQHTLFNPFKKSVTGNELGNDIGNNHSYSSSSNNINTTTTALPDEWKNINFGTLQHIGFSETQLRQLYGSNMTTPEIVQDAINRFAYSLEHNNKTKAYNDPLNVLMGILRKGQRWIEHNYVSPKELSLRQILEEKRKQKEQRDIIIKELIDLEFPNWKRKLTEEEIIMIVPEDIRKTNLTAAVNFTLRTYFLEKLLLPRLEINDGNINDYFEKD